MVTCFACPEPGFNMPEEQWNSLHNDLRYIINILVDRHHLLTCAHQILEYTLYHERWPLRPSTLGEEQKG